MKNLDHTSALSSFVLVGTCAISLLGACTATDSIGGPGDASRGGNLGKGGATGTGGWNGTGGGGPWTGGAPGTGGHDGGPVEGPADGPVTSDGALCQSPNVWRYQEPGCEAPPVCASGVQDACATWACGCDGEILEGCDYFTKPWKSRGLCPDACFSPTQNLDYAGVASLAGCSCDPGIATPQCLTAPRGRRLLLSCVDGKWKAGECPVDDGGLVDGADCQLPKVVVYQSPGCGADAVPVCTKPDGDLAMRVTSYCACDGVTTLTDDISGSHKPFLYGGACKQDAAPSDGNSTPVFCQLSDGRRIQAGAAFSESCNGCVCKSSGQSTCHLAGCPDAGPAGPCQSDADCGPQPGGICVFDPGCDPPRGTCHPAVAGMVPLLEVEDMAPFEYCGCDGVTFGILSSAVNPPRDTPHKPYRHYGACTAAEIGLDSGAR